MTDFAGARANDFADKFPIANDLDAGQHRHMVLLEEFLGSRYHALVKIYSQE